MDVSLLVTIFFILVSECLGQSQEPSTLATNHPSQNVTLTPEFKRSALQDAMEKFTQSIYIYMKDYTTNEENPNFVFSPLSIHSALSMLFLGTKEGSQTMEELAQAMSVIENREIITEGYKNIVKRYFEESNFLFGNNIWVKKGFELKPEFYKAVWEGLNTGVDVIDFGSKDSVNIVNSWISDNTGGKIKELVKEFSSDTSIFLANALYFKEQWRVPFEDEDFRTGEPLKENFTTPNGVIRVPMIQQISSETGYKVVKIKNRTVAEVIIIPYKNPLFEMQIILPTNLKNFNILESALNRNEERDFPAHSKGSFQLFSDQTRTDPPDVVDDIYLKMPTFNVRTDTDASKPLQELGAKKVFTTEAELDELATGSGEPLYVSSVSHTAVIEVTKEGTEGAAATGIEIVLLSASFGEQKSIVVDRPFIFVVQDRENKLPVLVGRITDPSRLG